MRSISKERIADMLRFVERQITFTIETTQKVESSDDFLMSQDAMVLYNSTCMCLQTIGETLKQIDDLTDKLLLREHYPEIPWRAVFGIRNIISHEYAATDPDIVLQTVKRDLMPLLSVVSKVITDIEKGAHDVLLFS